MTAKSNFPTVPLTEVLKTTKDSGPKGYRPVVLVVDDESAIADEAPVEDTAAVDDTATADDDSSAGD